MNVKENIGKMEDCPNCCYDSKFGDLCNHPENLIMSGFWEKPVKYCFTKKTEEY